MQRKVAIVNPNSANGLTGKIWPQIAQALQEQIGDFDVLFTECMGHAIELSRQVAESGADLLVSIGGDGTNNEVVNGLMREDGTAVNPELAWGIVCMGTGGDFRKTAQIPKDYQQAVKLLAAGDTRRIDVGRMEMTDNEGRPAVRYFVNIASFGLGGEADNRVNNTTKVFGGFVSFAWGCMVSMLLYRNKLVHIVLDDEKDLGQRKIFNVAVANGQFFGGGMHVAPGADLSDGLFDVVLLGDFKMPGTLLQMSKIYKAKHLDHPLVEHYRAKKVTATSDETVLLDVDGEQPGRLPTTFTICPRAILLKAPAS